MTIYKKLGGYDVIAAIIDDFMGKMMSDKQLGRFYVGLSTNSKKKQRQLIVDLICEALGGPCFYTGRDLKTAHTGLNITESDWKEAVKLLESSLDKFKISKLENIELSIALSKLKKDIVGL